MKDNTGRDRFPTKSEIQARDQAVDSSILGHVTQNGGSISTDTDLMPELMTLTSEPANGVFNSLSRLALRDQLSFRTASHPDRDQLVLRITGVTRISSSPNGLPVSHGS